MEEIITTDEGVTSEMCSFAIRQLGHLMRAADKTQTGKGVCERVCVVLI